jgi:hypothetical protein
VWNSSWFDFFLWYFGDGLVLFGGFACLGKTVPSYRWALESEIDLWRGFRRALTSDEDKQAFDAIMDMCRNNSMAAGNACNPILFEPMVMSILLGQLKNIRQLEKRMEKLVEEMPNGENCAHK